MTMLGLIRHGETEWNRLGKMQGHADIPLTDETRSVLKKCQPPTILQDALWLTSPLERARDTAMLLGVHNAAVHHLLIETDWGDWQGLTLEELRSSLGDAFLQQEGKGRHFRPPNGESPADVMSRLQPFLNEVGRSGRKCAAVTHKGVIRAVLALAYNWDMTTPAPIKLTWQATHLFDITPDGSVRPLEMNVPFVNIAEGR